MTQNCLIVVATERDLASQWRRLLLAGLQRRERPKLSGMTPHSDLVLMNECAAEWNLKLHYEGIHDCRGRETVTHSVRHRLMTEDKLSPRLATAGIGWASTVARSLCEIQPQSALWHERIISGQAPRSQDNPGTLVSWLFC
jgi:hypothetical protein